jgi:hypothetical protein
MKEVYGTATRVLICLDTDNYQDPSEKSWHSAACSTVHQIADFNRMDSLDPAPWERPGYVEPPFPPPNQR